MVTDIAIRNLQKRIPISQSRVKRVLTAVLVREKATGASLSLAFVTDRRMRTLNRKFHKRDHPTDVLAFPLGLEETFTNTKDITGEIIISTDTVYRNAKVFGNSPQRELELCLIHGVLHLLGFDDHHRKDIARMRQKEQECLRLTRR